jgi:hypothetical protein
MTYNINAKFLPKSQKFNVLEGMIKIAVCIGQLSVRVSSSDHAILV